MKTPVKSLPYFDITKRFSTLARYMQGQVLLCPERLALSVLTISGSHTMTLLDFTLALRAAHHSSVWIKHQYAPPAAV